MHITQIEKQLAIKHLNKIHTFFQKLKKIDYINDYKRRRDLIEWIMGLLEKLDYEVDSRN